MIAKVNNKYQNFGCIWRWWKVWRFWNASRNLLHPE